MPQQSTVHQRSIKARDALLGEILQSISWLSSSISLLDLLDLISGFLVTAGLRCRSSKHPRQGNLVELIVSEV